MVNFVGIVSKYVPVLCAFASEEKQVEEEMKITERSVFVTAVSSVYGEIMKTVDFIRAV